MPTFAEAVAALPDGMGFAIDTKAPDAADAVVDELRRQGKLDRSLLWAQSERAVRRYAELAGDEAPEVALLRDAFTADDIDRFLADAVDFGATAISAHQDTVDEAFIERAHGLGLKVHCWFQDLATQARLATLPLDGIVTDWPVDARAQEPRLSALSPAAAGVGRRRRAGGAGGVLDPRVRPALRARRGRGLRGGERLAAVDRCAARGGDAARHAGGRRSS